MAHVKSGLKQDTLAALRQVPLDLPTLFPDAVLRKADKDISNSEDTGQSHTQSAGRRNSSHHPYKRLDKQVQEQKSWKQLGRFSKKKGS